MDTHYEFDPFLVLAARWVAFERVGVARCVLSHKIRSEAWRVLCGVAGVRLGARVVPGGELASLIEVVSAHGVLCLSEAEHLAAGMRGWMAGERLAANVALRALWAGAGYAIASGNRFVYKVIGSMLLVIADPAEQNWLPDPAGEMRARVFDLEFYDWIAIAEQVRGLDGVVAVECRISARSSEALQRAA